MPNLLRECQIRRGIILAVFMMLAHPSNAIIVGGDVTGGKAKTEGGVFTELSLPFIAPDGTSNTVGDDNFNTFDLYAFNEDQNVTLTETLSVNIGSDISAGTTVASHYVFYDPAGTTSTSTQKGFVEFDAPILGIITTKTLLDISDSLVNDNVTYKSPALRGLESFDVVSIDSGDPNRLLVDWAASTPGDYIRVLTGRVAGW